MSSKKQAIVTQVSIVGDMPWGVCGISRGGSLVLERVRDFVDEQNYSARRTRNDHANSREKACD